MFIEICYSICAIILLLSTGNVNSALRFALVNIFCFECFPGRSRVNCAVPALDCQEFPPFPLPARREAGSTGKVFSVAPLIVRREPHINLLASGKYPPLPSPKGEARSKKQVLQIAYVQLDCDLFPCQRVVEPGMQPFCIVRTLFLCLR